MFLSSEKNVIQKVYVNKKSWLEEKSTNGDEDKYTYIHIYVQ